jgi:two-component system LytT family response regulator
MTGNPMSDADARHDTTTNQHRPIRVLIVDDEPLARQRLTVLLGGEPDVELLGDCANGLEALHAIAVMRPDLVFLDVQIPELDGLGVVEALGEGACPDIVFVTAHSEYMERAFEVHALDYLRKPYTNARFQSALAHARRRVREARGPNGASEPAAARITPLLAAVAAVPLGSRIAVQDRRTSTWHIIRREDIDWIEAADGSGQVCVHFGREVSLWRRTLTDLERELAPHGFLRVHRCHLVNGAHIRRVKALQKGEYALILSDGTVLDTGRRYQGVIETFLRSESGDLRAPDRGRNDQAPPAPSADSQRGGEVAP